LGKTFEDPKVAESLFLAKGVLWRGIGGRVIGLQ